MKRLQAANVTSKDFRECLTVTNTMIKQRVTKTSIVELALACACDSTKTASIKQIATFITSNLRVNDCFHKRENKKTDTHQASTLKRVRNHITDTVKNQIARNLYAFDKFNDTVIFSDMYRELVKTNKEYRRAIVALTHKIKSQYKV